MSSECVLSGLSNNRQCFNFGLPRLVSVRTWPHRRCHQPDESDNLSCYVMSQLWTIMTKIVNWRLSMVIRIAENFQGCRVRPSGHSHTLSASSLSLSPSTTHLSHLYPFLCEYSFYSSFPLANTTGAGCTAMHCKLYTIHKGQQTILH